MMIWLFSASRLITNFVYEVQLKRLVLSVSWQPYYFNASSITYTCSCLSDAASIQNWICNGVSRCITTSYSGAIPANFQNWKHRNGQWCYACVMEKCVLLGFGTKFTWNTTGNRSTFSSQPPYCVEVLDHLIVNNSLFLLRLLDLPVEMHAFFLSWIWIILHKLQATLL